VSQSVSLEISLLFFSSPPGRPNNGAAGLRGDFVIDNQSRIAAVCREIRRLAVLVLTLRPDRRRREPWPLLRSLAKGLGSGLGLGQGSSEGSSEGSIEGSVEGSVEGSAKKILRCTYYSQVFMGGCGNCAAARFQPV
jgi:hypothetical protein